jgi:predicted nucleic acid-binding protein
MTIPSLWDASLHFSKPGKKFLEQMLFEVSASQDGTLIPGLKTIQTDCDQALADLQTDLDTGAVVVASVDWADVHRLAERLSARHTGAHGHRAFDVLHVATALHLGAREFLTFDASQRKLAAAEKLKVKP